MAAEGLSLDDLWPARRSNLTRLPREHHALNLTSDLHAYFYGLALADGSIRENRRRSGALAIEMRSADAHPLLELHRLLPWKSRISVRRRPSPFGAAAYGSTAFVSHAYDFRQQMTAAGFPIGAKSHTCAPPSAPYNQTIFWRGFLDGGGSLGISAKGLPFVSLVTVSPAITDAYLDFIKPIIGYRPKVTANKRDGAWNIMLMRGRAISLAGAVYQPGAFCIPRKAVQAAIMAGDWQRDEPLPLDPQISRARRAPAKLSSSPLDDDMSVWQKIGARRARA